ncbi:hypothetical protein [Janthinobacterium sp. MDT1-19]|uniref:hypothetical protein n=1 Tax=Janthinobacterium sp. MDT1-19 TaxID=1259339 RepID=UPI003F22074B
MRTEIVYKDGRNGLVAGMKWANLRNYTGKGRITKDVRDKANLTDAQKIVIHSVDNGNSLNSSVGMYVKNMLIPEKAKNLHSLAVAFVRKNPQHRNMVLLLKFDKAKYAFIVIHNGIPVADEIKTEPESKKLLQDVLVGAMGEKDYSIFTNDSAGFPGHDNITAEEIMAVCTKATRLISLPPKVSTVLVASIISICIAGAGLSYYQKHIDEEKRIAKERETTADPVAPYQLQLLSNINKLGLDRQSIIDTLKILTAGDVWSRGWLLSRIDCTVSQCITTWSRNGGTTAMLLVAHPDEKLLVDSTEDVVKLLRSVPLVKSGIKNIEAAPLMEEAYINYVNRYQDWKNAGIQVTQSNKIDDFKTWPKPVMGDIGRLPKSITLKARPIEVIVPLHLAGELIMETPQAVWWESFTLKYSPTDLEKRLTILLKGNTYVR